jgi:hypothetical protein
VNQARGLASEPWLQTGQARLRALAAVVPIQYFSSSRPGLSLSGPPSSCCERLHAAVNGSDPPEGFVEECLASAQSEAAMIQESRRLRKKWHTDMINDADRYLMDVGADQNTSMPPGLPEVSMVNQGLEMYSQLFS